MSILKLNNKIFFGAISLLGILSLTGCVSNFSNIKITDPIVTNNKISSWNSYKYKHMLMQSSSWRFEGVVGISMPGDAQQARVSWNKKPNQYQIKLSGPLGLGEIKIEHKPGIYKVIDEKGHVYTNSDPEVLLEQITGWTLPLSGANFWVLGLIKPEKLDSTATTSSSLTDSIKNPSSTSRLYYSLNKYGSLDKLQQNGWEIDYRQYRVFNGVMLPVQIIFYNKSKQLRIKLVIQNWGF